MKVLVMSSNSVWRVGSDMGGVATCVADAEASRGGLLLMFMSIGLRTSGGGTLGTHHQAHAPACVLYAL